MMALVRTRFKSTGSAYASKNQSLTLAVVCVLLERQHEGQRWQYRLARDGGEVAWAVQEEGRRNDYSA